MRPANAMNAAVHRQTARLNDESYVISETSLSQTVACTQWFNGTDSQIHRATKRKHSTEKKNKNKLSLVNDTEERYSITIRAGISNFGVRGGTKARDIGSTLVSINAVALHWARLVAGWAGKLSHYVTSRPPRPTQPSIPPGSVNEYQL